ncbi:MAG: hypothetical protein CO090_00325 [Acidobacteria bacterium CG_4_9_14_3_um_filter_49_7]|nr:MAG: hypothetical protein CO090_00325 [Acidobacteria bacterium CG_4_9_14_3_um_filter_49_7]
MRRATGLLVTWLQTFYFFQFHETASDPETRTTGLSVLSVFTSPLQYWRKVRSNLHVILLCTRQYANGHPAGIMVLSYQELSGKGQSCRHAGRLQD